MKKILTLLAVAAMVAVACDKNNDNNGSSDKAPISIDGDFADWAALDASKVVVAKNAEGRKGDSSLCRQEVCILLHEIR